MVFYRQMSKNSIYIKKSPTYKNFNKNKNAIKRKNIKCGTIILNNNCTKFILVLNKFLYDEQNIEKWGLPKGHIINKETYADCAMRETFEETGIHVYIKNSQPKILVNTTYYYPIIVDENKTKHIKPLDTNEIKSAKWFNIKDIATLDKNRDLKIILSKFKNRIKNLAKLTYQ